MKLPALGGARHLVPMNSAATHPLPRLGYAWTIGRRLSLFLLLGMSAGPSLAADAPPAFSLIFRNDTADVERFLREGYARAQDDHLTVSLGARLEGVGPGRAWELAADVHVTTERKLGHRADLALLRASRPWPVGGLRLHAGAGLAGVGNFGGELLQNGYHRLSSNAELDLAYPARSQVWPLVWAEAAWPLWQCGSTRAELGVSALETPGFHRERMGLAGCWQAGPVLMVEAGAGAVWHHGLHPGLAASFASGPTYGALLAWSLPHHLTGGRKAELCAFFLANGARQDQSLPGLALRLGGPGANHRSRLDRVAWGP